MVWRRNVEALALALAVVAVVACPVAFASNAHGAGIGRRLLQQYATSAFLAEVAKLQPNNDVFYDRSNDALAFAGGDAVRSSPPPPASAFGRSAITPLTAAVGLIIAGFASGLMLLALLLWVRNGVEWDFRLKDIILVWLARRRLMPVVPRDSLPRSSAAASAAAAAAAAAAAQDAEPGGRGGQQPGGTPAAVPVAVAVAVAGPSGAAEGGESQLREDGRRGVPVASAAGGSAAGLELAGQGGSAREGRGAGGRPHGGQIVPVVDVGGGQTSGPAAGPSSPLAFRTAALVGVGEPNRAGAGPS